MLTKTPITRVNIEPPAELESDPATSIEITTLQSPTTPEIPTEFMCPITLSVMVDPVITADGHSYERGSIEDWLLSSKTSPLTNRPLTSRTLIPNQSLRSLIDKFWETNKETFPDEYKEFEAVKETMRTNIESKLIEEAKFEDMLRDCTPLTSLPDLLTINEMRAPGTSPSRDRIGRLNNDLDAFPEIPGSIPIQPNPESERFSRFLSLSQNGQTSQSVTHWYSIPILNLRNPTTGHQSGALTNQTHVHDNHSTYQGSMMMRENTPYGSLFLTGGDFPPPEIQFNHEAMIELYRRLPDSFMVSRQPQQLSGMPLVGQLMRYLQPQQPSEMPLVGQLNNDVLRGDREIIGDVNLHTLTPRGMVEEIVRHLADRGNEREEMINAMRETDT